MTDGSSKWYAFPETPFRVRTVPREDAAALAAAVDSRVAAVIMEPVLGMAGAVDLSDAFLRAAREAATPPAPSSSSTRSSAAWAAAGSPSPANGRESGRIC